MNNEPTISKVLHMIYLHVSPQTFARLSRHTNPYNGVYVEHLQEGNVLISIPSASETSLDLPDDLREVFRYARRHDCQFIYMEKCGGVAEPGLPVYPHLPR